MLSAPVGGLGCVLPRLGGSGVSAATVGGGLGCLWSMTSVSESCDPLPLGFVGRSLYSLAGARSCRHWASPSYWKLGETICVVSCGLLYVMGSVERQKHVNRQRPLTDKMMAYVLWKSVGPDFRDPPTVKEFAESQGVSVAMVHRWAKDPRVTDAVRMLVLANSSDPGRISNVLDFLYETVQDEGRSIRDRLQAAKQWLDTTGVSGTYKRESEIVSAQARDDFDLSELSDVEIAELYRERTGLEISAGVDDDGRVINVSDLVDD